MIKDNLNDLKQEDLYSLVLFSLYKMIPIPEYSSISELAYVLDKDNLLNLCEYFGGQTIKIPTIEELEDLIYALLLNHLVKVEGLTYEDALKRINKDNRNIRASYFKLQGILNKYEFTSRDKY